MNELYTVNWARTQECFKDQLIKPTDPTDAGYDIFSAEDSVVLPYSHIPWEWEKVKNTDDVELHVLASIIELNNQQPVVANTNESLPILKIEDGILYRRKYKFKYIETGIRLQANQLQWFGIYSRSSCAKYGIGIANSLGVIDYLFSNTLKVSLYSYDEPTFISKGERIAQLIPRPQLRCQFIEVPEEQYEYNLLNRGRRAGFGSSGTGISDMPSSNDLPLFGQ